MCSDIPSHWGCFRPAGGSQSLETRLTAGGRCAHACTCVHVCVRWEWWGRIAGSRQKVGRRPSSDWCLVITGKWLSHWPLAKVPVEGNGVRPRGPAPSAGGSGRAHVWCCKKWGSRTDRADFTRSRLFLLRLGGVSTLMARSYFPEPGPRSGRNPQGPPWWQVNESGLRGLLYHQDGSHQVRGDWLLEGWSDSQDKLWYRGANKIPVRSSNSAEPVPSVHFSPPLVFQHHGFFFIGCKNACQIHSPYSIIFWMPWVPYTFCSLIIAYMDKLVNGSGKSGYKEREHGGN